MAVQKGCLAPTAPKAKAPVFRVTRRHILIVSESDGLARHEITCFCQRNRAFLHLCVVKRHDSRFMPDPSFRLVWSKSAGKTQISVLDHGLANMCQGPRLQEILQRTCRHELLKRRGRSQLVAARTADYPDAQ
jgi:hypothetical protein